MAASVDDRLERRGRVQLAEVGRGRVVDRDLEVLRLRIALELALADAGRSRESFHRGIGGAQLLLALYVVVAAEGAVHLGLAGNRVGVADEAAAAVVGHVEL